MNEKMRSCVMGLILGQFSSPLPRAQKEPVAYLYNGVRLPKLPEWDREKYPYAYIWFGSTLKRLYVLSEASHMTMTDSGGNACIGAEAGTTYMVANTYVGNATWGSFTSYTEEEPKVLSSSVGWANYDIRNADGTLYLSASEPIPVYE